MKTRVAFIVLVFMLILASCSEGDFQENSSYSESSLTSSEFNISEPITSSTQEQSWVEIEEFGNEKITSEYRNGKKDYTVTIETFYDDGSLYKKTVSDYKNSVMVLREEHITNKDGSYTKTTDHYSDSGEIEIIEIESFCGKYVQIKTIRIAEALATKVEYFDEDDIMVATGSIKTEMFQGLECTVERLDIIRDSNIVRKQVVARLYGSSGYSYFGILNEKENVLFSIEKIDAKEIIYLSDDVDITVTTESGITIYETVNGELIAKLSGSNIVQIGEQYDANTIVSFLEEKIALIQSYLTSIISLN
jgi:major membrane immunogen (membrane-anchored lipoprotein)